MDKNSELCQDEFKLDLTGDIDMLLMFEKDSRGWTNQAVKRCAKANNRYIEDISILIRQAHIFNISMQTTFKSKHWSKNYQHMCFHENGEDRCISIDLYKKILTV